MTQPGGRVDRSRYRTSPGRQVKVIWCMDREMCARGAGIPRDLWGYIGTRIAFPQTHPTRMTADRRPARHSTFTDSGGDLGAHFVGRQRVLTGGPRTRSGRFGARPDLARRLAAGSAVKCDS